MRFSMFVALNFFIIACAQEPTTQSPAPPQPINCPGVTSPDQQFRACVLSVGRHPNPPFNESRVEIRNMKGAVLATKDFKSPDGEHGRNPQKMEWSPNSQFFVFSTASSGGPDSAFCSNQSSTEFAWSYQVWSMRRGMVVLHLDLQNTGRTQAILSAGDMLLVNSNGGVFAPSWRDVDGASW